MANQYSTLTRKNILIKVNRKRNPVKNMAQLAREFGYNTYISGRNSTAAPGSFRNKVRALVGDRIYNQIRDDRTVNRAYR